jgi:predicted nucleic acid-binding protein
MMSRRPIVLDANILIRLVVGEKVPALLAKHSAQADFLAPDTAFDEARRHLPAILNARGDDGTATAAALARIGRRDPRDWPVLACALLLDCPVWTEDRDFFGTGVATWTTALVDLYFTDPDPGEALDRPRLD